MARARAAVPAARPAPGARCSNTRCGPRRAQGRGRRAAVPAQPDRPRPGRHRPVGGRRGHLPGSDRPGPRERPAHRARVRPGRAGLAAGPPGAGAASAAADAAEALSLSRELEMGLCEVWATAALGELELGLGDAGPRGRPLPAPAGSCSASSGSPTRTCRPPRTWPTLTCGSARMPRRARSPTRSRYSVDSSNGIGFMPYEPQSTAWWIPGKASGSYNGILTQLHRSLYRANVGADFVFPNTPAADLAQYKLLIVPCLYVADDAAFETNRRIRPQRRARPDDLQKRLHE